MTRDRHRPAPPRRQDALPDRSRPIPAGPAAYGPASMRWATGRSVSRCGGNPAGRTPGRQGRNGTRHRQGRDRVVRRPGVRAGDPAAAGRGHDLPDRSAAAVASALNASSARWPVILPPSWNPRMAENPSTTRWSAAALCASLTSSTRQAWPNRPSSDNAPGNTEASMTIRLSGRRPPASEGRSATRAYGGSAPRRRPTPRRCLPSGR